MAQEPMQTPLLDFFRAARSAGLRISPAESIDAVQAVTLEELVATLEPPRILWSMVPAGPSLTRTPTEPAWVSQSSLGREIRTAGPVTEVGVSSRAR